MKDIKVLGKGCAKCETTAKLIQQIAAETRIEVKLEKVTDYAQIAAAGVMTTPAVMIDGRVVHSGSVPGRDKIESWLRG